MSRKNLAQSIPWSAMHVSLLLLHLSLCHKSCKLSVTLAYQIFLYSLHYRMDVSEALGFKMISYTTKQRASTVKTLNMSVVQVQRNY